ncbi:MAG TPA: anthrone oxygenase family protein [Yinghuangia sp.]|uniref:anthrone oxygenase family protein n=1 Tax=Yinghuangia sp. YIM S10712 TaxID=3436930 RepID=UPI002BD3AC52|nr:anthrone oxygenase family protein [Yinghuangia sp.]
MNGFQFALTMATALGCIVIGGVFFGFSALVMPALRQAPAKDAVGVMQAVNTSALTFPFLPVFLGSALASAALGVWAVVDWDADHSALLVAGAATYLVGSFVLTVAYHVPRNEALDKVTAGTADADRLWAVHVVEWTRMNHVRGLAAVAAGALLIAGVAAA